MCWSNADRGKVTNVVLQTSVRRSVHCEQLIGVVNHSRDWSWRRKAVGGAVLTEQRDSSDNEQTFQGITHYVAM